MSLVINEIKHIIWTLLYFNYIFHPFYCFFKTLFSNLIGYKKLIFLLILKDTIF